MRPGLAKAALGYFLIVFGAGFALALVRIPVLVPLLGVRWAELAEMPVMLAVIAWAAHRLVRRHPGLGAAQCLLAGVVALALLLLAELGVACAQGMRSLADIVAARDPVSGSVYLASLLAFALAPALVKARGQRD